MADLVRQNIEMVGLTGFEHLYPHQLSGGMRRRAELARALVVNPDILFIGRALSRTRLPHPGQPEGRRSSTCTFFIKKTIIFITHDIDEALIMGDRLVVLSERPAKVKVAVGLDFPHPRDFARNPGLSNLRKEIYQVLGVHYAL